MKWSLLKAASEFGVSRETVRRGLAQNGVAERAEYTTAEIHNALAGDLKKARAREALANAIAKERDNKIADREVVPFAEVSEWMNAVLLTFRQRLLSMPAQMASRTNPTDPPFAQAALELWVTETLPILRKGVDDIEKAGE
jgi:hypothetical protein